MAFTVGNGMAVETCDLSPDWHENNKTLGIAKSSNLDFNIT
jgi:hypothetical protein